MEGSPSSTCSPWVVEVDSVTWGEVCTGHTILTWWRWGTAEVSEVPTGMQEAWDTLSVGGRWVEKGQLELVGIHLKLNNHFNFYIYRSFFSLSADSMYPNYCSICYTDPGGQYLCNVRIQMSTFDPENTKWLFFFYKIRRPQSNPKMSDWAIWDLVSQTMIKAKYC